jgi:hypothetical protein
MGKGNSGKKSPAVMIFPFSRPHEGAKEIIKISQTIPSLIPRFISSDPTLSKATNQHETG